MCQLSISNFTGQYIRYEVFHSRKEVYDYISDNTIYSNQPSIETLHKTVESLCNYEDLQNRKTKIYAVNLCVMLPGLDTSQRHEAVKKFLLTISHNFKKLCYLYSFKEINEGFYADIVIFERYFYIKGIVVDKKYKRTMYINKHTGRTTNATDPDAVVRCIKNQVIIDKDGNPVSETIYVSDRKTRLLNYYDHNDPEKKKSNFVQFIDRLKQALIQALSKLITMTSFYKLKAKTYDKEFSKRKRIKILNYNQRINLVNLRLIELQELLYMRKVLDDRDDAYQRFTKLFYSLARITANEEFKVAKENHYKLSISTSKHQKFSILNQNLDTFVELANRKIDKWYKESFEWVNSLILENGTYI